jgi:HEAT repeats
MRKPVAAACLTLFLLGCDDLAFHKEATYQGRSTSEWISFTTPDNEVQLRRKAVKVLGELGLTETDQTVPALGKLVADSTADKDPIVRLLALKSLEKLAPKAKKAYGAVGRAMNDKVKPVSKQAMLTFKAIELAKPSAISDGGLTSDGPTTGRAKKK